MTGQDTFAAKPWDFLRSLEPRNIGWVKSGCEYTAGLPIVGQSYRAPEAHRALLKKKSGNRALLVREPANLNDPNAVAVLIAAPEDKGYVWTHCGYIERHRAADLTHNWYGDDIFVREASLVSQHKLVAMPKFREYC